MKRQPNRWKAWAGLNRDALGNTSSIIVENLRTSETYNVCKKFRNACTLSRIYDSRIRDFVTQPLQSPWRSLATVMINDRDSLNTPAGRRSPFWWQIGAPAPLMAVSMLRRQGTAHGRYISSRYHTMIPQASLHPKPRRAWSCPVSHLFLHWLHTLSNLLH
jgi:hypothetical protein